ncbi:unnamed protein product [Phytophthora lilii]|uniref:Unnamed protein product n=1 Tax=Phytophthora lilii TaxID=2077276 RepID=A0A9W6X3X1_9STRA|nr:unnamed protein product [Phytophthora lilii]
MVRDENRAGLIVAVVGIKAAVKFANEGRRTSDQEFAGNDVPATDYPQQKPCGCSQGSTELTKAISDLSRQLSQMSSALIGKISSVEDRLGRLESQVHDVWTAVEEQGEMARKSSSAHASIVADNASRSDGEQPSPADVNKRRTLDVETPCAWPPQPSVFERY